MEMLGFEDREELYEFFKRHDVRSKHTSEDFESSNLALDGLLAPPPLMIIISDTTSDTSSKSKQPIFLKGFSAKSSSPKRWLKNCNARKPRNRSKTGYNPAPSG